jgi:hypothetical protein
MASHFQPTFSWDIDLRPPEVRLFVLCVLKELLLHLFGVAPRGAPLLPRSARAHVRARLLWRVLENVLNADEQKGNRFTVTQASGTFRVILRIMNLRGLQQLWAVTPRPTDRVARGRSPAACPGHYFSHHTKKVPNV